MRPEPGRRRAVRTLQPPVTGLCLGTGSRGYSQMAVGMDAAMTATHTQKIVLSVTDDLVLDLLDHPGRLWDPAAGVAVLADIDRDVHPQA